MIQNICIICLNKFDKKSSNIKTLKCNHKYDKKCIEIWLKKSNTCPLCKNIEYRIVTENKDSIYIQKRNVILLIIFWIQSILFSIFLILYEKKYKFLCLIIILILRMIILVLRDIQTFILINHNLSIYMHDNQIISYRKNIIIFTNFLLFLLFIINYYYCNIHYILILYNN